MGTLDLPLEPSMLTWKLLCPLAIAASLGLVSAGLQPEPATPPPPATAPTPAAPATTPTPVAAPPEQTAIGTETEGAKADTPLQPDVTPADPAAKAPLETSPKPEGPLAKIDAGTFASVSARSIGPALMSGRIADLAINPRKTSEWYIAVASGNLWKTVNAGTTFTPIFDGYGSYSIGCVTLDPNNPSTVWVGTGENNSQRSVGWGDGVYVSHNGGATFTNVGLKESEHIGTIVIDPRDSKTVFVAAMGPLWRSGGERGVYRSKDAGATWERILHISDDTGVNEVRIDPRNPDVMYATAYQRRRHVWTLINGGPESTIYKSTDAGQTWAKSASGLPAVDTGKIGIAISPANPDTIYAIVEAAEGNSGIYRSTNTGATWEKRSGYISTSPQYYNELFADPHNVNRIYSMDTYLNMSDDGGSTWRSIEGGDKHVDNHALYIDPTNTDHLIAGCDGGLYESFDLGRNWRHFENLPVMQFYRVAVDNAEPFYNVYGGTQDNSTLGGPSRTTDRLGITNEDWFVVVGGDGFEPAIDPTDPNIVYGQWQHAGLVRFDRTTGESTDIKPREKVGDAPYVWHWDSPLLISPHSHTRLYFGADRIFRSDDRGDSWTAISADLTRNIDRNTLKVMGKVQTIDAVAKHMSTSIFGNCVSLTESRLKDGLLYAGTDDGLVHVTKDGGATWRKIETFPVVPDMTYVSDLESGWHAEGTVFATFDNHKNGDFTPYVLRSDDSGETWRSIAGDLPANNTALTIAQDHVNPNLLFIGTEFGAYYTIDGGTKWVKISGLPTIPVRDIDIQRRENDLALATFGRGFYIVDNYTPLRFATDEILSKPAAFFPIKPALAFIPRSRMGGGEGRGWAGASHYSAPNPALGATFTFSLKDKLTTLAERRKESQGKDDAVYPTLDQTRAELLEQEPEVFIDVRSNGTSIRRVPAPRSAGVHRVTWDLRHTSPGPADHSLAGGTGVFAVPGSYTATLCRIIDAGFEELTPAEPFEVKALDDRRFTNPAERSAFDAEAASLQAALSATNSILNDASNRITLLRRAVTQAGGVPLTALTDVEGLRMRLATLRTNLYGDEAADRRNEPRPPSIADRIYTVAGSLNETSAGPTTTQREQFQIARDQLNALLANLKTLIETDLAALEARFDEAGAPWTPGRWPIIK